MSSRQRNYRQIYRERIASWYNGYPHIAIIYLSWMFLPLYLCFPYAGCALVGVIHRASGFGCLQLL